MSKAIRSRDSLVLPKEDDDLIDRLLEHNARFAKLVKDRLCERSVSIETAARRLATAPKSRRSQRL